MTAAVFNVLNLTKYFFFPFLGFSVPDKVEDLRADSSELPEIKSGVFVKLSGLGGCGEFKT